MRSPGSGAIAVAVGMGLASTLLGSRLASASNEEPEALIRQGVDLRRQGDDLRAHGYFKRAYDIAHTPRSAAQLGLCEQAVGDFLNAETHLTEALSSDDLWVQSSRDKLESSRATARSKLGRVLVNGAPAGATVVLNGRPPAPLPADGVVWVKPGDNTLSLSAPDHQTAARQVTVAAGAQVEADGKLVPAAIAGPPGGPSNPPLPPPPPPVVEDSRNRRIARIAGLAAGGVGLAVVVIGVLVYESGVSKRNAIQSDAMMNPPVYNEGNGNYRSLGNLGVGLMVGGAVALAGGTVVYLLNRGSGSEAATAAPAGPRIAFGYLPGLGATMQLGGTF